MKMDIMQPYSKTTFVTVNQAVALIKGAFGQYSKTTFVTVNQL